VSGEQSWGAFYAPIMAAAAALKENCAPKQELEDEKKSRRNGTGLRPVFTGWKPAPLYFHFSYFS
jgi:hypothetical protein